MAHLLLVEDNKHLQILYQMELSDAGHSVRIAATLAEALDELTAHPPALVLLDLHLPDADGQDTLARIVQATPPHIPIIVNTAYDRYRKLVPEDRKVAYILKSSDLSALKHAVAKLLRSGPRAKLPPRPPKREPTSSRRPLTQ